MSQLPGDLSAWLEELLQAGELIPRGDGYLEDMGGHIIRDDTEIIASYFREYLRHLSQDERDEVLNRLKESV